ncbi:hypothetical protein AK812_SmicGene28548 [Symbiodinium microadriaticum]|uniref:Uncharacterized protein n=1 Tax=Symbiodinium microadriaticum TaxID=2951 RepID=A0A1Q9D423_SYMMI|nr:hypothetical protein AK812_SmicGene28548 [Symbiodinium microadriaticum]
MATITKPPGDSAAGAIKAPIPPPPAPKTYAAVWNLSTDYTSKVIKEMLEDVDFAPDTPTTWRCRGVPSREGSKYQ